ncbi:carbohydrate ABC transporter permease [Occultella gossypii]|uniref:Sugar ABC transporter permease n=1 Tax=Occultella gossypii TaxID=2800820 RepID=A0ABS7S3I2_9MICO|nr:sugar ABC transporter permease [Occultella gossypii]MBZ2194857.1 sugar ABC transporter permease [Occultella gossypii]
MTTTMERPIVGGAPPIKRRRLVYGMKWWVPWLFVAPALLGMVTFLLVPLLGGLLVSFTQWDVISGLDGIRWVGLDNFTTALTDPKFWAAAGRTVIYAGLSVPLTVALGLVIALALNRPIPGRGALRVIFFMPAVVNVIAVGSVWLLLLNPSSGLVNQGLRLLGWSEPPQWIASPDSALAALIIMAIWGGSGYISVIYVAALQEMPQDLYEAARLDGAGAIRQFVTITWPALLPMTMFLTITQLIGRSQTFGLIAYMTSGGPGDSTTVLSYYMYQNGFMYYRFGYAAAMGVLSMLGVLVMTLLLWRYQKGRSLYGDEDGNG